VLVRFCPFERCIHYFHTAKCVGACYYEPQCWRGCVDSLLGLIFRGNNESDKHAEKAGRDKECEVNPRNCDCPNGY